MYRIRLPHELTEVKRKFTLILRFATFIPTIIVWGALHDLPGAMKWGTWQLCGLLAYVQDYTCIEASPHIKCRSIPCILKYEHAQGTYLWKFCSCTTAFSVCSPGRAPSLILCSFRLLFPFEFIVLEGCVIIQRSLNEDLARLGVPLLNSRGNDRDTLISTMLHFV